MYCGHARLCVCVSVCLSVCLFAAVCPHYCTDPDVTWGCGRGCPLVVHCWADLQSVHGWRCYGRRLAVDGERSQNCAPYMGSGRGWLSGDWPSTGGVLNITAAAWTAGFHWWRSGNRTRTQNVSEYMLVLALCLVYFCDQFVAPEVRYNSRHCSV